MPGARLASAAEQSARDAYAPRASTQPTDRHGQVSVSNLLRESDAQKEASSNTAWAAVGAVGLTVLAGAAAYGMSRGRVSPFKFLSETPSTEIKTSLSLGMADRAGSRLGLLDRGVGFDSAIGAHHRDDIVALFKFGERRAYPLESVDNVAAGQASKHAARLSPDDLSKPLADLQQREKIVWEHDNYPKPLIWKPSKASVEARSQAQEWVTKFSDGDYEGAIETALKADVMKRAVLNPPGTPHEILFRASEINSPELPTRLGQMARVGEFYGNRMFRNGEYEDSLRVLLPKPIVELSTKTQVALHDYAEVPGGFKHRLPMNATNGNALTQAETAEITALRNSPGGQRILAESSVIAFEESIVHANQYGTGNFEILSPTFARFSRDFGTDTGTTAHSAAFRGVLDHDHPSRFAIREQEVPVLAYDAGMPLQAVTDHFFFGGRHVRERAAVMSYLLKREGQTTLVPGLSP